MKSFLKFLKQAVKFTGKLIWSKKVWTRFISIPILLVLLGFLFMQFLYNPIFEFYTGVENAKLTYDSEKKLTDQEFESLADSLTYELRLEKARLNVNDSNDYSRELKVKMLMNTGSFLNSTKYSHIEYFRKAGIRVYKGPETCLKCHETMKVDDGNGHFTSINTMEDVLNSVHFKFQTMASGFSTYGYDGRQVNSGMHKIPVGKIDRACGIPGSFSWTGWAALIKTHPEEEGATDEKTVMRSEGCGQCHIGGNYHPATEKMMPIGDIPGEVKKGVDCLICHSKSYDMNYRFVIKDKNGKRWNQDRTMRAALTVGKPGNENCLNCHQHNMGGDLYEHNIAAKNLGFQNQRLLHTGAKRGNPFSYETDVHYRAGLVCTDCHKPEGHKIPRGTLGTDLVSNDLPGKKVACENCHTDAPHTSNKLTRAILNGHVNRLACESCHISHLEVKNVVLRDWVHPTYNKEEGMWTPTDIYRSGKPGKGFTYLWFNGNGTFLANALGDNPNGANIYNPLMNQITKINDPEIIEAIRIAAIELKKTYPDIDVDEYVKNAINSLSQMPPELIAKRKALIEKNIKPLMKMGKSKIYPFKMFNAMMYEDFGNQGPYGAMILPFDYNIYYQTGNPKQAVITAIQNPIVERMYQTPFKYYMMDEFMHYFGVDTWNTTFPLQNGELQNVYPRWMRQFGTLMVNHGISRQARECTDCHSPNGIMDFEALGYTPDRIKDLQNLKELESLGIEKKKSEPKKKDKAGSMAKK